MSKYIRTNVVSFSELPEETQLEMAKDAELSDLHQDNYVKCPIAQDQYLPLGMFMRMESSKLWDGVYALGVFSAYFIKIDPRNHDVATVGYRHW